MDNKKEMIVRENLERIGIDKYSKPRHPTCQGCSRCCDRVISTTQAEIRAVDDYLDQHPEVKGKIVDILKMVPENADVCPFLDLTLESSKRCMLYDTDVRFHMCRIFSCYFGSSYPEEKEEWAEKCKGGENPDPLFSCDLRYHFFGATKDTAHEAELRAKIPWNLF